MKKTNCPNLAKNLIILLILSLVFAVLFSGSIYALSSDNVNLQGKIVRNDTGHEGMNVIPGSPACVVNGASNDTCDFQVNYYTALTGGTLLLTEDFTNVEIGQFDGVFELSLGSGTVTTTLQCRDGTCNSPSEVISEYGDLYVELQFAPDGSTLTETFTRMPLEASPYAIFSKFAEGAHDAFKLSTSVSNESLENPSAGMIYFDTGSSQLKVYNGAEWQGLSAGTSSSLWTDAGTYSYLTSTTDDLVLGGSSFNTGRFVFDMDGGSGSYFDVFNNDHSNKLFTILNSGNVGIGTATPGAKLEVGGTASTITNSTGNLTISTGGGNGNILLMPNGTGNVGIGTTNPTEKLEVNGTIRVDDPATGIIADLSLTRPYYGRLNYAVTPNNGKSEVRFVSKGATSGTGQTYFVVASTEIGDTGNNLLMGVASGRTFITNALNYSTAGTLHIGGVSWAGDGVVQVSGVPTDATGKMTVMGNVGIGTTSPAQKLDVLGGIKLGTTSNINNVLDTQAQSGAPSGNIYWGNSPLLTSANLGSFGVTSISNSDGTLTISPTVGNVIASLNLSHANIWTGAQTFSANTYFPGSGIWNTSGNVGIGTTSPTVALDVAGDIKASGVIRNVTVSGVTSTAASTAAKVVNIPNYTLTTGDLLSITFTNGNSVSNPTLNVNSTGAKNIRVGNTNATTTTMTISAGATLILYYDGTYFQMMGSQRTSDSDLYDRTYWGNAITAGTTIYSYKLLMQSTDGKWYPLTLESGTGTTKTVSTQPFVMNSPILYYATTTTVSPNATFSNVYSEIPTTYLNYTANQGTWTSQLPIYLKGIINSSGNFVLDNTSYISFLTQSLPTSEDGFVYILLGQMYSTTGIRLFQYHPVYEYKNGRVQQYNPSHTHNWGSILNASGVYMDYRPNNTACGLNQVLKYDSTNSKWVCADDNAGTGDNWGSQVVITNSTLTGNGTSGSPLGIALNNANTWTGMQTFRGLTVDSATATDDRILTSITTGGSTRYDGTLTNADLTAARTWTLPNKSGTIAMTSDIPVSDNYQYWVLQANGVAGSNITSTSAVSFNGSGIVTTSRSGNTITITGTEADTLQSVTNRGATTTVSSSFTGGATIRGLIVDNATATHDRILTTVASVGTARYDGTLTNADLTAARTWTLPNNSGTIALTSDIPAGHDPVTLSGENYLSLNVQQITANKINLTSNVTGTLPIGSGGTNSTTYTSNQFLWYNGTSIVASGYNQSSFASSSHSHNWSQITNGSGIYMDYRPGNTACGSNQVLKYDAVNSRWICADDTVGTGDNWGSQVVITNSTLTGNGTSGSPLGIALNNANTWTGAQTFGGNTYFPGSGIWNTSGNVGIGTTSPTHKLELASATTASGGIGFGTDVELYRSNTDTLSLASGDNFNLVSGNVQIGSTTILTSGRLVQAANGSVSSPAFSFSSDTNTGMYGTGSDTLSLVTNGTDRITINASGNVGIGTTSPTAYLHLKAGTGSANTAPLKFTTGTNLTTPESGAMEWDGSRLYITNTTPTRNTIAYLSDLSSFITQGYQTVQEEGSSLTQRSILNFIGSGITAVDDSTNSRTNITLDTKLNAFADLVSSAGVLTNNGSGGLSWVNLNSGDELLPVGTEGQMLYNNAGVWTAFSGMYWDDTNSRLGIGTTTPNNKIQIIDLVNFDNNKSSTYLGEVAGKFGAGGSNITAIGTRAGYIGSGDNLTAVGRDAGYNNKGTDSSLIGYQAGRNEGGVTYGNRLTAMGSRAGYNNQGNDVVALGYFAGSANTGSNSVFIGSNQGLNNTTENRLMIGNNSTISLLDGIMTSSESTSNLTINGRVGIATYSPTAYLHLKAGTATTNTAPLKFTAGTNLTTPESGAMEWDGSRLYITNSTPTRNTIAYTSDIPTSDNYQYWVLQANGAAGSNITSTSSVSFNGSGIVTTSRSGNVITITGTEADTLASVTGRGATTSTSSSFTGGATIRGLTVDNATATDDRILTSITTGGSARYDGTLTNSDLTAARTWTLPNNSGTIALTSDIPAGHNPVTLAGENYLSLSGQQITANKINLASNVTGTLPIGSGGTNSTTYTSNQFLWYNGTSIVASGYNQSSFASSSHSHDWSQITNGSGVYMNYKPNNTACASNQVLKYDTTNSRWICADDNAGTGGDNWGSQVVVTNSTLTGNGTSGSPLGIALSNANTWTGMQTFRGLTVDNATATDDRILTSITTVGSARYDGTLTNADLTAARTWTLPDATGTIALGTGTTSQLAYWTSTNTLGSLDYSGWDTNASDDVTTFLGLTDTPSSYTGSGNYLVRVNSTATALEFVEASAFTDTDNYVDSVDFAPGSGVLTLGRTGTLPDLTTSLDGRYLQSLRWDEIQNPQGYLTLDHGMYSTLFTFNSITSSTAFSMTSSSLATGYILGLSTTSTALTEGGALDISASGTPSSSWTGNLARIEYNNGSSNVNGSALKVGLLGASAGSGTALNVTTSQTGATALALRVNDDSTYTDPSPFVVDANGNVGVGVVSPTSKLVVNSEGYSTIELQYNDTPVVDIFSNVSSNIFIGLDSGSVITSGYGNVALGDNALSATTIGTSNTAIGYYALDSNVAKQGSTAIGYQAMRYADSTATQGLSYNTAVGYQALVGSATASANTGMYNTAIGHQSMTANTSGSYNSTLGVNTLLNNTIGQYNVAIGYGALFTNVAKNASVAIGYEAMRYADNTVTSSTSGNIAIGYQALRGNTTASSNTGTNNVAIGYQVLYGNTTGSNSVLIGAFAGAGNTTGEYNVGIGANVLQTNVAKSKNVAIGYDAMSYANNSDSVGDTYNTALGASALRGSSTPENNTGVYNTSIGGNSGLSMTSGSNNALLGYYAGYSIITGSNNSLFGYYAGSNLTTGSNNIIIGASINADSATGSYQLNIGNAIKGDLSTGDINIVGNLGINGVPYTWPSVNGSGLLTNNGIGGLSWTTSEGLGLVSGTGSAGQISYWSSTTSITGSNSFWWDSTNNRLGIGTNNPLASIDIAGSTSTISNASGNITITPTANFIVSQGNVGIGTTAPFSLFSVGASSQFQINSSGDIVKLKNLTYSWPSSHTTNGILANDGSGGLSWTTSAGLGLVSGTGSAGQVSYWSSTTSITGSNNFWWDSTNSRLGIGTNNPQASLSISGLVYQTGLGGSTYFGENAGRVDDLSNNNNTGIGYGSLYSNTTGYYNTALGNSSLYSNTTGYDNTAVGVASLLSNTTGVNNIALGNSSLRSNTTGHENTALGHYSLYKNTTGHDNLALGYGSLNLNTTGSYNIAVGNYALISNTTSNENTALGNGSLNSNTTGSSNTAVGGTSLYSNITGNYNVALGYYAGRYQADGSTALTDPEYSIYIGNNAKGKDNDDNNSIVIGYNAVGLGANTVVLGNDSIVTTALKGYVGIGVTAPTYRLQLPNTANNAGKGQANAWVTYSDKSLKENIQNITGGLDKIMALRGVTFDWKGQGVASSGFIAQEVDLVIPDLVSTDINGIKALDYGRFTPYLVEAIKEQQLQIQTAYNRIEQLENINENKIISITTPGWYRISKLDTNDDHSNIKINNTSVGSSQNIVLSIDSTLNNQNINIVSNLTTGEYDITKARINNESGVKYLEIYIPEVNENKISVKITESSNWIATDIVQITEEVNNAQEYALSGILFGISDKLEVEEDNVKIAGDLLSLSVNSSIGDSANRWNDIYAKGTIRIGSGTDGEGAIRFNVQTKTLEFSNNGVEWLSVGDLSSQMTISPEYAGAILFADGSDNSGIMTSDAVEESGSFKNYYEWVSNKDTPQDYDILVRITLPADFLGWKEDAIYLDIMTENSVSTDNNSVGLSLIGNSGTDVQITGGISKIAGTWERMSIKGSDITQCNSAGGTCTLRISLTSSMEYFTRVGDITLNYNRSL